MKQVSLSVFTTATRWQYKPLYTGSVNSCALASAPTQKETESHLQRI